MHNLVVLIDCQIKWDPNGNFGANIVKHIDQVCASPHLYTYKLFCFTHFIASLISELPLDCLRLHWSYLLVSLSLHVFMLSSNLVFFGCAVVLIWGFLSDNIEIKEI